MKIGIIGSGNIGATLAKLLTQTGHDVLVANSRGPASLADLVAELGARARAGSAAEAAHFGEVVIEAIPFGRIAQLPVESIAGKILVSASNYYPGRDGDVALDGRAESQYVAAHLPGARLVKGFNTIWFQHLATQGDTAKPEAERRAIFIAGDDAEAKRVVAELIASIGFGAVDTGDLAGSAVQQPGAPIYNVDLTVEQARAALAELRDGSLPQPT